MAKEKLQAELLISAGVKGVEAIERASDALGDMSGRTAAIKEEAAKLKAEWDKLAPEEQARRLESLANAYDKAEKDNAKLNQESDKSAGIFQKLRSEAAMLGAALAGAFAINKLSTFVSGSVQLTAVFEEQLSKVRAVSGATAEEMAKIEARAKELGAATRYTATEAAEGFEILARAGLNAQEQLIAIPDVLALAQGAGIGLADAASYITRAVRGMNLSVAESGRVADVLAKAAASANTDVAGLGQALSYAAPSAASLNLSLEDTVAIIGKFADAGIDASRAGTALNSILSQFSNPASTFRRALADVGITTNDFSEALRQMADKGDEASTAIIAVGQEAGPALKALLAQGMPSLDELKEKLTQAGGSAQEMAEIMDDNLPGAVRGLSSAWEGLKIALAQPMLDPLKKQTNELSATIRDMVANGTIDKLGQALATMASWAGTALSAFIKFAPVLATFGASLLAARTAIAAKNAALSLYASRANLAAAAISKLRAASMGLIGIGLTAAIYATSAAFKALKSNVDEVQERAKASSEAFAEMEQKLYELKTAQEGFAKITSETREAHIAALEEEAKAIDERIRAYEDDISTAEKRLFTDKQTIESARAYIQMEEERKARIEKTIQATHAMIEAEEAHKASLDKARAIKNANIEGWAKLADNINQTELEAAKIPERSQEIIDALRLLSDTGENTGAKLRLAFTSAFEQAETQEALAKMQQMLREAFEQGKMGAEDYEIALAKAKARQEELPPTISRAAIALQQLGIEATTFNNQMSHGAQVAIDNFRTAAKEYGTTQERLAQIFTAAQSAMQNDSQYQALKTALFEVGESAGFAREEIERIATQSVKTGSEAALAFQKMGVDIQEALTGISTSHQTMINDFITGFQLAAEEGLNLKAIAQSAFENLFNSAGSEQEFKALNQALRQVGAQSMLSKEQQQKLKDAIKGTTESAREQAEQSKEVADALKEETEESQNLLQTMRELNKERNVPKEEDESEEIEKKRKITKSYGETSKEAFKQASEGALASKRATEEAARAMQALTDSSRQTVASLEQELMRLRGESEKLAKFQQQQKEAELKSKANEALTSGNMEAYREYQKALQLQRQIYAEQQNQARKEKAQSKSKSPTTSAQDSAEAKAAAQEVASAFAGYTEAQMQEAKRQAREELMNELKASAQRMSR